MELSTGCVDAAKRGEAVRLVADGIELVILRADAYERVKNLLYDEGVWSKEELRGILARSSDANGWNDPAMDAYDNYDEELKKRSS